MSVPRADWDLLVTEYKALQKQLRSKQEALLVLQQQVETLEQDCLRFKAATRHHVALPTVQHSTESAGPAATSSTSPARVARQTSKESRSTGESLPSVNGRLGDDIWEGDDESLEMQLRKLTAQHNEVVLEKRSLQQRLERLEAANKEKGVAGLIAERDKALKERNELVQQLEQSRANASDLQLNLDASREEHEEAVREKGFLSEKCGRLNEKLLHFLKEQESFPDQDSRNFVDIDAITIENKYLKERLSKSTEEKQELIEIVSKSRHRVPRLRDAIRSATSDTGNSSGTTSDGKERTGAAARGGSSIVSSSSGGSKSVHKVYNLRSTIADLQAMVATLNDSLRDKNLALQHSKSVNKTLAQRVMELEKQPTCMSHGSSSSPLSSAAQPELPSGTTGSHKGGSSADSGADLLGDLSLRDGAVGAAMGNSARAPRQMLLSVGAEQGRTAKNCGAGGDAAASKTSAGVLSTGEDSDDAVEWQRDDATEADRFRGKQDSEEQLVPTDSESSDGGDSHSSAASSPKGAKHDLLAGAATLSTGVDLEFTTTTTAAAMATAAVATKSTERSNLLGGIDGRKQGYGGTAGSVSPPSA